MSLRRPTVGRFLFNSQLTEILNSEIVDLYIYFKWYSIVYMLLAGSNRKKKQQFFHFLRVFFQVCKE